MDFFEPFMLVFAFCLLVGWRLIILKETLVNCLPLPKRCPVPVHISYTTTLVSTILCSIYQILTITSFLISFISTLTSRTRSCLLQSLPVKCRGSPSHFEVIVLWFDWAQCKWEKGGIWIFFSRMIPAADSLLIKANFQIWCFNPVKRRASESLECLIRHPDETKISPFSTN